ncbi:MAG TPA: type I glutamate--ammonia ligase [Candidatus Fimousia stercorigallinarum]|nr:type I glutamate--ammonia ligase [Candidatus Fimousia stercorigallinarum]
MSHYTKQDIIRLVEENNVEFIRLQFTDVFGTLKNVAITAKQLEKALDNKCMFDGSSVDGFVRIDESDMYLYPDLDTFSIFTWRSSSGRVARLICDVYRPDGVPFQGDPRGVLKRVLRKAVSMGYNFCVGPELEFFLFHTDEEGRPTTVTHEKAGYFDVAPLDLGENARRDIVLTLEEMGFDIEASHHEVAPAQHEIDLLYANALKTADNIMTFKLVVKSIAKRHGLYASFMPKPISDVDGSGMHLNMSLWRNGKNIFADSKGHLGISQEGYHFLAGLLRYAPEMTLIMNPLINSYKRLVPGYEAPIDITWSTCNRSPLIRIPAARGVGTRVELRSPDAAANPYLALAVCLAAGLAGIEEKIEPTLHFEGNTYQLTREEKEAKGIQSLPRDMRESIRAFRDSEFMKEVLGEHIFEKYISAKGREWHSYQSQVTDWEINEYLYKI